jgi:glycopeptide antibiotics resistance protein
MKKEKSKRIVPGTVLFELITHCEGTMKKSSILSLIYSQIGFFILLPVWIKLTKYLHPLVIVIVWLLFSSLVLLCVCWVRNDKIQIQKHIIHIFAFLYSLGLLVLLFFRPNDQNYDNFNLIPFHTINFYLSGNVDFLIAFYNLGANIGLFIPYGLYDRYMKKNHSIKQLLIITLFSIALIECLQFLTKRGCLDIDDLILNVSGVILGYYIQPFFQKILVVK